MATDWNLIRTLINSAIDACELAENLGPLEPLRGATTRVNGMAVTVYDFLQSAHVYPENLKYSVIRARHLNSEDKPYTPELARILLNIGALCAELVDCNQLTNSVTGVNPHNPDTPESVESMIKGLATWYADHFSEGIAAAIQGSEDFEE
ncbi:MAG: hypothetical protein AAGD25_07455 [Cyanobacteria bacterium P01_F01_bin.150]